MANYVSNDITVVGNEKVQERMNQYVKTLENLEKYSDTGGFASTFYKHPNVSEGGGTMNTWAYDNIGAKWAYFEHTIDDSRIMVTSAWEPVKEFTMHLYNLLVELDPEVAVENRFNDEGYDPVGGMLVYKNHMYYDEDSDFEYPDEDEMDEDEDYEVATMNFYEEISDFQDDCIARGYEIINEGGGETINYKETEEETV